MGAPGRRLPCRQMCRIPPETRGTVVPVATCPPRTGAYYLTQRRESRSGASLRAASCSLAVIRCGLPVMRCLMAALLLLAFMVASVPCRAQPFSSSPIDVLTLEWPPYVTASQTDNGVYGTILKEAFRRSGFDARLIFLPWARSLSLAEEGRSPVLAPAYSTPKREGAFIFSEPLPVAPIVLIGHKGHLPRSSSPADLRGLRIGVVRDYAHTEEFDSATGFIRDEAPDDASNLRKLLGRRVDLIAVDLLAARHLVSTMPLDQTQGLEILQPPLAMGKLIYACFPKRHPRAEELRDAFNTGLRDMRRDGTLDRMLAPLAHTSLTD